MPRQQFNCINDDYRFVFFHVPKTAGCSIKKALLKYQRPDSVVKISPHPRYSKLVQKFPHVEDYFKFAIIRNPWDRFVSAFLFLKRGGFGSKWPNDLKYKQMIEDNGGDMKSFLKSGFDFKSHINHMKSQHIFLCDKKMNLKTDYVGEYTTLQKDFDKICDLLKIKKEILPHTNKTRKDFKRYTEYYNEETKQIVAEKYAKDIELFGYEFGE